MMQNTISRRLGRLAVKACALLASQIALHAGPEKGAGHSSFPPVNLGEIVRGEKARAALGAHLPEVAKVYNLSVEDLQKLLNDDPSLAVDIGSDAMLVVRELGWNQTIQVIFQKKMRANYKDLQLSAIPQFAHGISAPSLKKPWRS